MTSTTVNLPVNLQVKNLSFSAHVDAKGILQLISQCRPKNVVLVHGEGGKMKNLKLRIVNTFNCPVYFPANGEVLFIETLPGAAKSIEISRSLWGKRRRDISEGAIEIVENELLDEASKIEMLIESANLQDRLDSIDLSEGILTNCSINSRPLILSAFESSNSPQHIPSFTTLKNDVRRFFLRDKLMKINVKSQDFVAILHLFLLK
jgi:hypothetical protein